MKKVLIAEDSSVIQNLAKKILEFQNFEIHAVKNGQQVLDELAKADFDIILLDKLSNAYELGIYAKGAAITQYLWQIGGE